MSRITDEIMAFLDDDDDFIAHVGKGHLDGGHSGRYPWGSGDEPYQHDDSNDFISRVEKIKKENPGFTDTDVAKELKLTTTQLRTEMSICNNERRAWKVHLAKKMEAEGYGPTEIGRKLGGVSESTVRSLLNSSSETNMNKAINLANDLKKLVDEKGMIDVGSSVERELNVSREKLNQALYLLEREGYPVYKGGIPQTTNPGQQTNQKVLCVPGTEHKEIYNYDKIGTVTDYISRDGGETLEKKFNYPASMDSKRLKIRYAEDGGLEKDGLVEIRRGVEDLSLGESRYSQVRILVDGTHYIKGMAVYSDGEDMPEGVDVVFNTNKKSGTPALGPKDHTVLKPIKKDPENPFGSAIKDADQGGQYWYTDSKTGKKKLGLINKRSDEGDWEDWKDALPSQFLAKQSTTMAKKQLGLAKADKLAEYDEICSLTNPTVKKYLLKKFSDECDSAAVTLQAAALPGQKYHVIIPIASMKDNEIYAPNYESGTKVALIRYPHGGTFEIPILTVNNKHQAARKVLGTTVSDAVGINKNVADRLSGADFDGDTVMVIPTHDRGGKVKIASTDPLKELEGFDGKDSYGYDEVKTDSKGESHYYRNGKEFSIMKNTGNQMGRISNLITDMTLAGAGPEELARAVKHSMVVIDAEKHKLDYKQSEIDNDIKSLIKTYQAKIDKNGNVKYGGASTILSRSKGEKTVDKRQGTPYINMKGKEGYDPKKPEGALIYKTAKDLYYPDWTYDSEKNTRTIKTSDGKKITYSLSDEKEVAKYTPVKKEIGNKTIYTDSSGKIEYAVKKRTQKSSNMMETDDAYDLVSKFKHPMEIIYADYANDMKNLANKARIELSNSGKIAYSREAKNKYEKEVESLNEKLNIALLNSVRERTAQRMSNASVSKKIKENPEMTTSEIKKAAQKAITQARSDVGSVSRKERNIKITDKEWEAIQSGAISENKLKQILDNSDIAELRARATPRTSVNTISTAKIGQIKAMAASNYTLYDIAEKLNVSTSTVSKYLKGEG